MIAVILYGELGKLYGKHHKYSVKNVAEAIRALSANFKGFANSIRKDGYYKVLVDKSQISEEELEKTAIETIKIVPIVQGAGKGIGQVIAGVALVALAWYNPMGWGALNLAAGPPTQAAIYAAQAGALGLSAMSSLGMSLMLGGVSQMLTKTPNLHGGADRPDNIPSYAYDGPVNTAAQGNPVPLAYGRILVGSQVISAGLEAV